MVACRSEQRRHIDVGVNVIRPAVQKKDSGAIGWASLGIADVQHTGLDLL